MRGFRQGGRGLEVVDDADQGGDLDAGACVRAVTAELASLSATDSRPGLAEGCLAMARILDQPKLSTTHPSAAHQLWRGLNEIRNASHVARGKLASVAALTARKP